MACGRQKVKGGHGSNIASSRDRKSTRLNSSHGYISYAVFCLKKKKSQNCKIRGKRRPWARKHGLPSKSNTLREFGFSNIGPTTSSIFLESTYVHRSTVQKLRG